MQLTADGHLLEWRGDPSGTLLEDHTALAHRFLFEPVQLTDDMTLRSVFQLLQRCPPLVDVFGRYQAQALLLEALGPEPAYDLVDLVQPRAHRRPQRRGLGQALTTDCPLIEHAPCHESTGLFRRLGLATICTFRGLFNGNITR